MRRIFIGFVILNLLFLGLRLFGGIEWLADWGFTPLGRVFGLTLAILALIGSLFFAVDACRRNYDQERQLAIALAVVGVMSLGVTTVFYYLRWGSQPNELAFSDRFCDGCLKMSCEYSSGLELTTINYAIGGRLVGRGQQCDDCGSTIRTHCLYLFGIPLYSRGSFRVQCPATDYYLVRKCDFYWPHLLTILLMPAVIATFVLIVVLID